MKNLRKDICGPRSGSHKFKQLPDLFILWPEIWSGMSKEAQRREKQQGAIEKTKFDFAGKLRGIADREFNS